MTAHVGVALSSGGAAGLAHIGVLEELVRAGVQIHFVTGTSAGAMVGAAFAAGHLEQFHERALSWTAWRRMALFDLIWPRNGLLGGRRAMELLGTCAEGPIENLPVRYAAVATDLDSGRRVSLCRGDIRHAIRASIAIPGVFTPRRSEGRLLVDGALTDPIPVGPARELGADFVIASSVIGSPGTALSTRCFTSPPAPPLRNRLRRALGFDRSKRACARQPDSASAPAPAASAAEQTDGLTAILYKASAVVQTAIAAARLRDEPPDFLIAPAAYDIGLFDVQRAAEAIEIGRAATRAALPALLEAIERMQATTRSRFRWWPRHEGMIASPVAA
ncbi:MAG: patatin-like phospholipase family protein [Candidatus Binatia bacterium]